jgi:aminoglycoside phosphotransferase
MPGGRILYLKAGRVGGPDPVEEEIVRLEWMATKALPVPRIVEHVVHGDVHYLVTEALPGEDASAYRGDCGARGIVAVLAAGLKCLHGIPIDDCPYTHDAASRVRDATERVHAGFVDSPRLDPALARRAAETLLERLVRAHEALIAGRRAGVTVAEGKVFTHGDYCLPNVIVREQRGDRGARSDAKQLQLSGFIDCGRAGVADRYQDLALCARSITRNLGRAWIPVFFEDYGIPRPDEAQIEFYTLLDDFF